MVITIINDCQDSNAAGRQIARTISLFGSPVSFIGVQNELEAAGNLIDALDAVEGREGIVLANVAPRHKQAKKWTNGSPFGYFRFKKNLIISTVDGLTLSLAKKLRLFEFANVLDMPAVLEKMISQKFLPAESKNNIVNSQFRSYDFLPRAAFYLLKNKDIESEKLNARGIPDAPKAIWWVDNFGNCKTTLLPEEISFKPASSILTKIGKLNCFPRLKDVPAGKPALIVGSSGLGEKRFLEIVIKGASAAKLFNLTSGKEVF